MGRAGGPWQSPTSVAQGCGGRQEYATPRRMNQANNHAHNHSASANANVRARYMRPTEWQETKRRTRRGTTTKGGECAACQPGMYAPVARVRQRAATTVQPYNRQCSSNVVPQREGTAHSAPVANNVRQVRKHSGMVVNACAASARTTVTKCVQRHPGVESSGRTVVSGVVGCPGQVGVGAVR